MRIGRASGWGASEILIVQVSMIMVSMILCIVILTSMITNVLTIISIMRLENNKPMLVKS